MITDTPMCPYCGAYEGLRMIHDGGGYIEPEFVCEDCFTPSDDGPCFDDLAVPHAEAERVAMAAEKVTK